MRVKKQGRPLDHRTEMFRRWVLGLGLAALLFGCGLKACSGNPGKSESNAAPPTKAR